MDRVRSSPWLHSLFVAIAAVGTASGRAADWPADTAAALARFKGLALHVDGLTAIDVPTARALAAFVGRGFSESGGVAVTNGGHDLSLSGLKTLDAETAAELAVFGAQKFGAQKDRHNRRYPAAGATGAGRAATSAPIEPGQPG